MAVALLNEIVLLGLGLFLGYKAGSKKEQLRNKFTSFFNRKEI
mgnify:FL=1